MRADHREAPVLDALAAYKGKGELAFTPPGHKQARGADPAVRAVLGDAVFFGDLLAIGGLDDRRQTSGVLLRAEALMAEVGHRASSGPSPVRRSVRKGLRPAPGRLRGPGHQPHPVQFRGGPVCHRRGVPPAFPAERAAGRVAAEMMTPYPPGIPAVLPGERLTEPLLRYLRTGVAAGMNVPDAADPTLRTVRVCKEGEGTEA